MLIFTVNNGMINLIFAITERRNIIMVFSTVLAEETAAQAEDLSNVFVVLMGMGTVFVGLICLVILCLLTSFIIRKFVAQPEDEAEVQTKATAVSESPIANRQEFIAAVSAAIAEELGTSVNAIRIKSVKKI